MTKFTNDANIDYFSDFNFLRFAVIGMKVCFQIKKRKPYFYRFSFLLLYIAAFASIWQLLATLGNINYIFAFFIRIYLLENKHIAAEYTVPVLTVFTKNPRFCRILLFCANCSKKLFNHKYAKLIRIISVTSKIIFCMGAFLIRPLITIGYLLPHPGLLFLMLIVNGVFRSIITAGIFLNSKEKFIKEFLEILKRNSDKNIPTPPSENQEKNTNADKK